MVINGAGGRKRAGQSAAVAGGKEVSTYEEAAYTAEQVMEAIRREGLKGDVKEVIAKLSTKGLTLTAIAEKLRLNPQRFWAYYQVWCRDNAEPLRLNDPKETP